jgi:murein DD-endopeptidase
MESVAEQQLGLAVIMSFAFIGSSGGRFRQLDGRIHLHKVCYCFQSSFGAFVYSIENRSGSKLHCIFEVRSLFGVCLVKTLKAVTVAASLFSSVALGQELHPAAIPVDLRVTFAPHPVVAEGKRHIVYELHLSNYGRTDLAVRRLEVLDAASGAVLSAYEGEELLGIISRPGTPGLADRRTIGPGLQAVAFVDVIGAASSPAPRSILNRVTFDAIVPPNGPLQSIVVGPVVSVDPTTPVALGPPLEGSGWLASHGLSNFSSHRRTLLAIDGSARTAQRFAIDWTRIGPDGQVFRGDPAKNENWTPYGAPVLAVGNGRVVEIQDGIPENDPTSDTKAVPITLKTVGGNYLILDLGGNRYAFYAHLKPGSFLVRKGVKVKRGQRIAQLGNSGQSDAPHLHLHIMDAPSPLAAEGLPLVFDSFELLGHIPSLTVLTNGTGWKASAPASLLKNEMPIENAVVAFPMTHSRSIRNETGAKLIARVTAQGNPLASAIIDVALRFIANTAAEIGVHGFTRKRQLRFPSTRSSLRPR